EPATKDAAPKKAERLIFCSGKVYYDLCDYREKNQLNETAIVRIEQLYPLHRNRLAELADNYAGARVVWCQEEPQNMGAWSFIAPQLEQVLIGLDGKAKRPRYVGRPEAAATATGLLKRHNAEQAKLVDEA